MAAVAVIALSSGGCFASWATAQLTNKPEVLDESIHESSVPMPDPREELRVTLPLEIQYDQPATPSAAPGAAPSAMPSATPRPFALTCTVRQLGQDTVYHSAFRYGHKWKVAAAVMFALEVGAAAAFYFDNPDNPGDQLGAALLAADALGTGVIAFAPRKEIYRSEPHASDTLIRTDCPDGLAVEVGSESLPIDAAGRLGELGDAALDEWMQHPHDTLRLSLAGRELPFTLGSTELCVWRAAHHPSAPNASASCGTYPTPRDVGVTIAVPVGTLTRTE